MAGLGSRGSVGWVGLDMAGLGSGCSGDSLPINSGSLHVVPVGSHGNMDWEISFLLREEPWNALGGRALKDRPSATHALGRDASQCPRLALGTLCRAGLPAWLLCISPRVFVPLGFSFRSPVEFSNLAASVASPALPWPGLSSPAQSPGRGSAPAGRSLGPWDGDRSGTSPGSLIYPVPNLYKGAELPVITREGGGDGCFSAFDLELGSAGLWEISFERTRRSHLLLVPPFLRRRKKGEFIHKTCGKSIQGNTSGQLLQFRQLPKDRRIRGGNWELFQLGKLQSGCTGSSRSPSFLPSFPACLPACLPAAAAARIPISAHPAERGRTERGERGAPRARPAPVPPTPPAEPAESDSYCGEEFSCTRANT
ncbi:uncharacterized protein LOC119696141 isoform X2 [Motacilla alba alba]|uniref:uncharacterized protein LOC119696141 isoform X2 n=1 Tax=Motacilla alba alba TaxID=1094192 RepID=UPI0018D592FA|nr:uncharacterized protein LOC119696141 isoform X2 [Motacilla alba alba]